MKKIALLTFATFLCISTQSDIKATIHDLGDCDFLVDSASIVATEYLVGNEILKNEKLINALRMMEHFGITTLPAFLYWCNIQINSNYLDTRANQMVNALGRSIKINAASLACFIALKQLIKTKKGKALLTKLGWYDVIDHASLATVNGINLAQRVLHTLFRPYQGYSA